MSFIFGFHCSSPILALLFKGWLLELGRVVEAGHVIEAGRLIEYFWLNSFKSKLRSIKNKYYQSVFKKALKDVVFIPHIFSISMSRSLYFESFSFVTYLSD